MRHLLSNGFVYCATLVLTGRACIETIPSKFQNTKNPRLTGSIPDSHKTWQHNTVKNQDILKTIDITIKEALDMEAYLEQYITKLEQSAHTQEEQELNSAHTSTECNTYNAETVQCINASTIPEEKKQTEIVNIRPEPKKEAIQPMQFVPPDLEKWATNVHNHIPKIKDLHLAKTITQIENKINLIIDMRKKDNDRQLTDGQKEMLRSLKTQLKQQDSPCFKAFVFYREINARINASIEISKPYLEVRYKEAVDIYHELNKVVKRVNSIIDGIKIQPSGIVNHNRYLPKLGVYKTL